MNVLAFLGSPREGGNSEILMKAILRGVTAAGGRPEIIRLCDLAISPCISCGYCNEAGECIVEDDMTPLYDKIINTPKIILASPIFFYGVTAQAKCFIDRTQALWNRKRLRIEQGDWQKDPERAGFFVSVAATKGKKVFDGAVLTMKYACDAMDIQYGGELLIRGIDKLGEMAAATEQLQAAEAAGRNFILDK